MGRGLLVLVRNYSEKRLQPVRTKGGFPGYEAKTALRIICLRFGVMTVKSVQKLALLPTIFHFAEMAKGNCDEEDIARKFKEKFGIGFDEFLSIDLPNMIDEQEPDVFNPSKYMLYNDCFLGIYDYTVDENTEASKKYTAYSKKLCNLARNERFGYVFDTAAKLCKVLSLKYEIGVKTRSAYKNGDKEVMTKIIADYTKIIRYLEAFYQSFKKQWYTENKGFGFEVQAARMGGLIRRVKDCRDVAKIG
ncbi:MAG: hypothetical protein L6V85_08460 [Clostridiales bacterium]|nr:MAG: hypothetical protein L6V85_08460 [Clostridiales bacterium]